MPRSTVSVPLDPQLDNAVQQLATQKGISRTQAASLILRYGVCQLVKNHGKVGGATDA